MRLPIHNDPRGLLNVYKHPPFIIDEFQRLPNLTRYLQEYAEEHHTMGQLLPAESRQFQIGEPVSNSIAGQAAQLQSKDCPASLERRNQVKQR